jgi:lipid-A-disaccharide synthase
MVITYRVPKLTAWIMRRQAYLPWVGLPNILANRDVVPELVQENATPDKLADALLDLLTDSDKRDAIEAEFTHLHEQLRRNTAERMSDAILPYLAHK